MKTKLLCFNDKCENHGKVVFDGTPDTLDDDALTKIYGEEDWNSTSNEDVLDVTGFELGLAV